MSLTLPQQLAAQADAIALDQLTLIGLVTGPTTGLALLRAPNGDIARLSPGDSAFGVTLAAVSDDQAIVSDASGTTFALRLPGA